jgi:hypothetical protein
VPLSSWELIDRDPLIVEEEPGFEKVKIKKMQRERSILD